MAGSDLTTEVPGAGDGEVVDGADLPAGNGHAAKRRKRQKALAAAVANGHVSKLAKRNGVATNGHRASDASNGALVADELALPAVDDSDDPAGEAPMPAAPTVFDEPEIPTVDEIEAAAVEAPVVDEPEIPTVDEPAPRGRAAKRAARAGGDQPAPRGRAAKRAARAGGDGTAVRGRAAKRAARAGGDGTAVRGRAAKRAASAGGEPALRGRAAKRAARAGGDEAIPRGRAAKRAARTGEPPLPRGRAARREYAAYRATPAARRAELVATSAEIAAANAEAAAADTAPRPAVKTARRVAAIVALSMVPAAVYALAVTDGPGAKLSRADTTYLSSELIHADQRVRAQLVRLRPARTAPAIARTRDATLTARSLAIEVDNARGADAERLRRALELEASWLDAVGSVLANPRSALRGELVARDAELRAALDALPGRAGRRQGGAAHLVRYAQSRIAARRSV